MILRSFSYTWRKHQRNDHYSRRSPTSTCFWMLEKYEARDKIDLGEKQLSALPSRCGYSRPHNYVTGLKRLDCTLCRCIIRYSKLLPKGRLCNSYWPNYYVSSHLHDLLITAITWSKFLTKMAETNAISALLIVLITILVRPLDDFQSSSGSCYTLNSLTDALHM